MFAVLIVVILAGCSAPVADDRLGHDGLGEVNGVTYQDDLTFENETLSEGELAQLVNRSMARIEVVRDLEFADHVDVDIISRETYEQRRAGISYGDAEHVRENAVWQALFVIGQDRDAFTVQNEALGSAVQGYYSPATDRIVIVRDENEPVNKHTLVHELVHALQDQHFGLDERPETMDAQIGYNGLVEGEAELVPKLYFDRCGNVWECYVPETADPPVFDGDLGLFLVLSKPYSVGPDFVHELRTRGGWDAVDTAWVNRPQSAEQIIYPDRHPDVATENIDVDDRSSPTWEPANATPAQETIGMAGIYAMFAHNERIDVSDPPTYQHPFADGWVGDSLLPYERADGEIGYVWEIAWETEADAAQFTRAYRSLLGEFDRIERGSDRYEVTRGGFAGGYKISQDGSTVRIVHGPSVEALDELWKPS